jgi:hypothetical protein
MQRHVLVIERSTTESNQMAMGWLKLNTDVDFQVESGLAVAGIIGGDHEGKVILAACSRIQGCRDTEEADVKATLRGLELMEDRRH